MQVTAQSDTIDTTRALRDVIEQFEGKEIPSNHFEATKAS